MQQITDPSLVLVNNEWSAVALDSVAFPGYLQISLAPLSWIYPNTDASELGSVGIKAKSGGYLELEKDWLDKSGTNGEPPQGFANTCDCSIFLIIFGLTMEW